MRNISLYLITSILLLSTLHAQENLIRLADDMEIIPLSEHVFIHQSYLKTEQYGLVGCNGAIYVNHGEAVVFDTPADETQTQHLYKWLTEEKGWTIKAVMINHFHIDCLGGLSVFHENEIPSYSNKLTQTLAAKNNSTVPKKGFKKKKKLKVSGEVVVFKHFGAGHTLDNSIGWVPSEGLLFGGCLLKSLKSGKGNLADADVDEWSNTMRRIKTAYPSIKIAIPGHGKYGEMELLDYTIEMFEK